MYDFSKIISSFKLGQDILSCERYGAGHINETFLLCVNEKGKKVRYILQRINDNVFKDVDKLMSNITLVTEFIRNAVSKKGGNPDRESLSLVYALDGKSFLRTKEGCFRVYKFITDAVAYQTIENPKHFYSSAVAFGEFAKTLLDFDATKLFEVIPNFHNTKKRFKDFENSIKKDEFNRVSEVKREIDFIFERKDYCGKIVDLLESGKMPIRVTHNDTKLNNVMLDVKTGEPVAVIDLDTVMPGSICYDFGDSIRFGCKAGGEDEKDLTKVAFNIELFEEYVKGYMHAVGNHLTKIEKDNLAFSAILISYECGVRFLTDYIDGDVYFRTKRPAHNLDRARTQFKILTDMERRFDKMQEIVNKYS